MEIKRTANAGVLLRLDGKKILLDGVCREVSPYPATPQELRQTLLQDAPDVLVYTHKHDDHYEAAFVSEYLQKTAGPVLGPADIPFCSTESLRLGDVTITPVESHHMGKAEPMEHRSYIIQGSKCIWFMGDASPLHWLERTDLPRPDVLIAPYGFVIGHGWDITKALAPGMVVLVHLPPRKADIYGLWEAVEHATAHQSHPIVLIPGMGETVRLL